MEIAEIKKIVLDAGRRLLAEGLVSRTWGNISHRVDENLFVITPSGRNYDDLTESDLVTVRMDDLSHEGPIKPSSEKGMHAAIYRDRPEIRAVIHTHQSQASAVAAARREVTVSDDAQAALIGASIRVADYALPGTKKLARATVEAICDRKAALLANHGATCIGEDMEEAFRVSRTLEAACEDFVLRTASVNGNSDVADLPTLYARHAGSEGNTRAPFSEDFLDALKTELPDHTVLRLSREPATLTASMTGSTIPPLLDDMAQIVGVDARVAEPEHPADILRKLKRRNAVLLRDHGALCIANSAEDADAVSQVLEKNCKAVIESHYLGGGHAINRFEAWLMRIVYQLKYSRSDASNRA